MAVFPSYIVFHRCFRKTLWVSPTNNSYSPRQMTVSHRALSKNQADTTPTFRLMHKLSQSSPQTSNYTAVAYERRRFIARYLETPTPVAFYFPRFVLGDGGVASPAWLPQSKRDIS